MQDVQKRSPKSKTSAYMHIYVCMGLYVYDVIQDIQSPQELQKCHSWGGCDRKAFAMIFVFSSWLFSLANVLDFAGPDN